MKSYEYWRMEMKKPKKRGRKPGVKVGPYKKRSSFDLSDINDATNKLKDMIKSRIKYLQSLLKKL